MNKRLQELMIQAGYAAPELASRANHLVELIMKDVLDIVEPKHDSRTEVFRAYKDLYNQIKEHFEIDEKPCEHVWVINNHLMSNGTLCNKCFTTSMHIPNALK
jgi:hypothetical protein